ncbi:F-box domain-containing protein [Mycena venus]|uniref:F-box domain-containing protein n=1 Tax=Mycena venus TaxID=2733690 RepID=A0A8H6X8J2_9AGAR|nr:F-box domain-containing protein [Mycena venus]
MAEIFMHFLPVYPLCPPLRGTLSPSLFTQICRHWREIAVSTPMLWRAITFSDRSIPVERLARICGTWFTRSGCYPLSIQISRKFCDLPPEVLAIFIAHRARFEYLKLRLGMTPLSILAAPMPLLCVLDLACGTPTHEAFREVPLLRTVILDGMALSTAILPWAQLTSLTLDVVRPDECFPVLQQACNLVHCRLGFFEGNGGYEFPDIALPCLESLVIKDPEDDSMVGYLNTFFAPALRSLEITERCLGEAYIISPRSIFQDSYRTAFPSIIFSFEGRHHDELGDGESDLDIF